MLFDWGEVLCTSNKTMWMIAMIGYGFVCEICGFGRAGKVWGFGLGRGRWRWRWRWMVNSGGGSVNELLTGSRKVPFFGRPTSNGQLLVWDEELNVHYHSDWVSL